MKTHIFRLLFFSLLLTSCSEEIDISKQKILFEVHYENYAWGYSNSGFLIDSTGTVRRFNLQSSGAKWHYPDSEGHLSAEDMALNYAICDSVTYRINSDSLSYYRSMIPAASMGKISEPRAVMADYGIITYSAFIYDKSDNKYRRIILKQYGDIMQDNNSLAASKLYIWLESLRTRKNK